MGRARRHGRAPGSGLAGHLTLAAVAIALLVLALGGPLAPPVHADGGAPNLVYIAGGGPDAGDLVVADIGGKNVSAHITIGGKPHAVVLSADNRFAYVTQSASNSLAVVDAQAKRVVASIPVGTQPTGIALDASAAGTRLVVVNAGADSLSVVDPDAARVVATVPVGHQPAGIAIANPGSGIAEADSAEVYVANSGADSVTVIDGVSLKAIATIAVAGGPESIVIPQNGGISGVAYVGARSGAIVAIRLSDHRVLGTLFQLKGGASGQMDYNATNGQIYVPDPTGGVVQVLRPASPGSPGAAASLPDEPLRTLPFAGGPASVAIPNDGSYAFVAAHDTGSVAMYDLAQRRTVATLAVGGAPVGMATGSYPPLLGAQAGAVVNVVLTLAVLGTLAIVAYLFIRADRRRQQKQEPPTSPSASYDEGGE
jgi:YVTN family beta-propeller protein